jgi:excisionase family DNA binding protein
MTTKLPTTELLKGGHMAITEAVWLTALEAAQYLRVEPRTLLMWARQGKVKGYVLSGTRRVTWRFRAEDLDATMSPPSVALTNGRIQ